MTNDQTERLLALLERIADGLAPSCEHVWAPDGDTSGRGPWFAKCVKCGARPSATAVDPHKRYDQFKAEGETPPDNTPKVGECEHEFSTATLQLPNGNRERTMQCGKCGYTKSENLEPLWDAGVHHQAITECEHDWFGITSTAGSRWRCRLCGEIVPQVSVKQDSAPQ